MAEPSAEEARAGPGMLTNALTQVLAERVAPKGPARIHSEALALRSFREKDRWASELNASTRHEHLFAAPGGAREALKTFALSPRRPAASSQPDALNATMPLAAMTSPEFTAGGAAASAGAGASFPSAAGQRSARGGSTPRDTGLTPRGPGLTPRHCGSMIMRLEALRLGASGLKDSLRVQREALDSVAAEKHLALGTTAQAASALAAKEEQDVSAGEAPDAPAASPSPSAEGGMEEALLTSTGDALDAAMLMSQTRRTPKGLLHFKLDTYREVADRNAEMLRVHRNHLDEHRDHYSRVLAP